MSLEGRIILDIQADAGRVQSVRLEPPRPVALAPLLGDRPVALAVSTIGALFSVCAMAQSTAAVEAVEAACGLPCDPRTNAARRLLVLTESLREHLLYICREQQQVTGGANNPVTLRRAAALPARLKQALFPDRDPFVPGVRVGAPGPQIANLMDEARDLATSIVGRAALGEMGTAQFSNWAMAGDTLAARLVHCLERRGLAGIGRLAGVASSSISPETGDSSSLWRQCESPLIRQLLDEAGGPTLLARIASRLVEAARLPGELSRGLAELPAALAGDHDPAGIVGGTATVAIDAARGRLQHHVVVRQGTIACYEITAPTSLHFSADGIAARSIAGLSASCHDALAVQVDLMLRSIDPCVAFEVRYR